MKTSVLSKIAVFGAIMTAGAVHASVTVGYDSTAPISNFGTPTNITTGTPYTINMTADSTDVFVEVKADSAPPLDFVNLYFSTKVKYGTGGSDVGFEIGNNDTFVPGGAGPFSTAGDGISYTDVGGDWNITIPWSYFQTDPQGLGFTNITADNDILRLNLSQSFGYSVAGGIPSYGSTELGEVTYTPAAAPDATTTMTLAGTTFAALVAFRRRFGR